MCIDSLLCSTEPVIISVLSHDVIMRCRFPYLSNTHNLSLIVLGVIISLQIIRMLLSICHNKYTEYSLLHKPDVLLTTDAILITQTCNENDILVCTMYVIVYMYENSSICDANYAVGTPMFLLKC